MSDLTILPRSEWRASSPRRPRTRRHPSSITEFFLHWPGSSSGWRSTNTKAEEAAVWRQFQRDHMYGNGWADIGYNLGMGNGGFGDSVPRVWTLRGAQYVPASQLSHNLGTISLVVLLGPGDPVTDGMIRRIRSVVRWAEDYSGNNLRVRGHGEVFGTACPGRQLQHLIDKGRFNVK